MQSFAFFFVTISLCLHLGRLTRNIQITHLERKMIFQTSMIMFHVNLPGCRFQLHIHEAQSALLNHYRRSHRQHQCRQSFATVVLAALSAVGAPLYPHQRKGKERWDHGIKTGRWQLKICFLMFIPIWGKMIHFDLRIFFQGVEIHQLVKPFQEKHQRIWREVAPSAQISTPTLLSVKFVGL